MPRVFLELDELGTLFWKHGQYQKTVQRMRLVPPSIWYRNLRETNILIVSFLEIDDFVFSPYKPRLHFRGMVTKQSTRNSV